MACPKAAGQTEPVRARITDRKAPPSVRFTATIGSSHHVTSPAWANVAINGRCQAAQKALMVNEACQKPSGAKVAWAKPRQPTSSPMVRTV